MTIEENADGKGGLFDAIKNMTSTVIIMVQTRMELLSTELEEERVWLTSILTWTFIALFFAVLAVIFATLLVVVVFWDSYRLTAIGILLGIFILAAAFAWRTVHNLGKNKARLFSATLGELSKDLEKLESRNEQH